MRVALVTGGARGLGRAIATRLAADGLEVVIADRAGAAETAAEIANAHAEVVDLADAGQTRALAGRVLATFGRCDVLVNNAAQLGRYELEELDLDTWRRFIAVNVDAAFLLCAELVPVMARQGGGRVVNIVSNTVWSPPPGMLAYVTTKAALVGFTRALALEYGGRGVTVNAVAPGLTPTPGSQADLGPEMFDEVRRHQAIDRSLAPEDIAAAVAYFVSDDAAAVTGQSLRVDGGRVVL
ncbi:MAG TPA: SDR family oxidoreductase [Solirubrobacteraceae bacterium]|jgi:NAD(P)-dependent dehydrogenase (short-subunit alcohol dehydrogenase family)|nr:SDR family oxidoreductase [Solirubrobacteraceae bacterium]